MNKEIKYIGFYDVPGTIHPRVSCLAATDKMDYVCEALSRASYQVHVISPSWFKGSDAPFQRSITSVLKEKIRLTTAPSFGAKCKPLRLVRTMLSLLWLLIYLLMNTRRDEKILVYHTPWLALPISCAKLIRGFHLVLEVEEVYSDAAPMHTFLMTWEKRLLSLADSYVFATEMLASQVGFGKPHCILYGRYQVVSSEVTPPDDGKIHLLYAGIIDSHKKGAFNALEAIQHLSSSYHLHIIGFGETDKLITRMAELNATSQCQAVFDGQKYGNEYIRYAQSCHIGLSTQTMNGKYLETSFPSKILSYLSMGLHVVSCEIDCVGKSRIAHLVTYYDDESPESIAEAIRSIDMGKTFDPRADLQELDHQFVLKIGSFMQGG